MQATPWKAIVEKSGTDAQQCGDKLSNERSQALFDNYRCPNEDDGKPMYTFFAEWMGRSPPSNPPYNNL
jgi:hypothetical protein